MAEKTKKSISWIMVLAIFGLAAFGLNFLTEKVKATGEIGTVEVTVAAATPTINWTDNVSGFHDSNPIILTEWSLGAGTTIVTTTFKVIDTDGWDDIGTTTIYVFRSGAVAVHNCTASNTDCYPSTSSGSAWNPTDGAGDLCNRSSTGTDFAIFWCTTSMWYVADATNVGSIYADEWWEVVASTSDLSSNYATSALGEVVDVNANRALLVGPNTINYSGLGQTFSAGDTSGYNWATTTVTTTGNMSLDVHFDGGSLTGTNDAEHIPAFRQHFTTTSGSTYADSFVNWLATTSMDWAGGGDHYGKTHDLTMKKPTTTEPTGASAQEIYWGIGIPSDQPADTYTSSTNLVATSTIINDGP